MNAREAHDWLVDNSNIDRGNFFQPYSADFVGAGMLARDIRLPLFNEKTNKYLTVEAYVYVLSHECDFQDSNIRPFSDYLLVCPILDFEKFILNYITNFGDGKLQGFLAQLAQRNVYRAIYIPCYDVYEYGGLLYFNLISHTHKSSFGNDLKKVIATTTPYSLRMIDSMLKNHLFRPVAR